MGSLLASSSTHHMHANTNFLVSNCDLCASLPALPCLLSVPACAALSPAGMQGVGKSCLVLRYVRNTFDANSKITVSQQQQQGC